MLRSYLLTIACIALLGLNLFLFVTLREKTRTRSLAYNLTNADRIFRYVDDRKGRDYYLYNETGRSELAGASKLLYGKIDTLRRQLLKTVAQDAADYFTKPFAIDPEVRSGLWEGYQKFDEVCTQFLETEVPPAHAQFVQLRDNAFRQFHEIEAKAKASKPGRHTLSFEFRFDGDRAFQENLEWIMENDSVKWSNGNQLFLNYIDRLERKINSTSALQTKRLLNKMADTFSVPGKLRVYGEVYDLSKVTTAELTSACKYLYLLQAEVEESMIATSRDVSLYR